MTFPKQLKDLEKVIKEGQDYVDKQLLMLNKIKNEITRTQTLLTQIRKMYDNEKKNDVK